MITSKAKILKFSKKGEKTGWSYIEISSQLANKLNPNIKKSFRIKGTIDNFNIKGVALLPMGDGKFILPMNATIRKGVGKVVGDSVDIKFEVDKTPQKISADLMSCLKDDQRAYDFFKTLPKGHQRYFSQWIEGAKTTPTKTKRITMAIIALAAGLGFGEMIRSNKTK